MNDDCVNFLYSFGKVKIDEPTDDQLKTGITANHTVDACNTLIIFNDLFGF